MGHVLTAGVGQAPARQAALAAGTTWFLEQVFEVIVTPVENLPLHTTFALFNICSAQQFQRPADWDALYFREQG